MRIHPVLALCTLAAATRALVALRTAMPERDAAHYLWMAEGVPLQDPERLFDSVFHPVFPLLVGMLRALAPDLDPVRAAQLVACAASVLAVWPLWLVTRRAFGERAAFAACCCFALLTWFVRHPADGLSEGVFHPLVIGWAALLAAPARGPAAALAAGVLAALAYGTRPEGATLFVVGLAQLLHRRARPHAVAFAVGCATALVFPLGWALWGNGFTLTPKAAFVWADGVGGAGRGVIHYLVHLVRVPGALLEALGWLVTPAALAGAVLAWRSDRRPLAALLLAPFALQVLVVPILRSHHRFLSGYAVLLLPFAGHAWSLVRPRLVRRGRPVLAIAIMLVFAVDLVRLTQARREARLVERDLGAWLGSRLRPGEHVASDMQRLDFFAGVEPAPPREITADELESAARDARTRFVVWVTGRTPLDPRALRSSGLAPIRLPDPLAAAASVRGIEVFGRD